MKFPTKLTEEEEYLKEAYTKLRKMKKALQALKTPKPEQTPTNVPEKRTHHENPNMAMKEAKLKLKSGQIRIDTKDKEKQGFKRSKNFERKMQDPDKSGPSVTFQPYSSTHDEEDKVEMYQPPKKRLYDNFVKGSDEKRKGHTVYVKGQGITEDILKNSFSSIGKIINISMEPARSCGFISFDSTRSADEAITQMNNSMISGVQVQVMMARNQPNIQDMCANLLTDNTSWEAIAASKSQKGSLKDSRDLLSYEDEDMFSMEDNE